MGPIVQSLAMYALAIVISLLVAVLIRGVVNTLSLAKRQRTTEPTATPSVPPEPAVSDIPAISAAVYAILGAHRIIHIEDAGRGQAWTHEGRLIHQTSHAVPHQPKR